MISNCGHDENNRYSGGKTGDQTGTESDINAIFFNCPPPYTNSCRYV